MLTALLLLLILSVVALLCIKPRQGVAKSQTEQQVWGSRGRIWLLLAVGMSNAASQQYLESKGQETGDQGAGEWHQGAG